jgi:hypothetical protein
MFILHIHVFDIGDPGVFKGHDCINMFKLLNAAEPYKLLECAFI